MRLALFHSWTGVSPGITLVRATTDANSNVHPISFGRYLASESDLTVGVHIEAEQASSQNGTLSNRNILNSSSVHMQHLIAEY